MCTDASNQAHGRQYTWRQPYLTANQMQHSHHPKHHTAALTPSYTRLPQSTNIHDLPVQLAARAQRRRRPHTQLVMQPSMQRAEGVARTLVIGAMVGMTTVMGIPRFLPW
jgi:hypothetical protein